MSGVVVSLSLAPDPAKMAYLSGVQSNGMANGWRVTVQQPVGAEVVAVGNLKGGVAVWVTCSDPEKTAPVEYLVIGSGIPAPDGVHLNERNHVGTALPDRHSHYQDVWHVFELSRGDLS